MKASIIVFFSAFFISFCSAQGSCSLTIGEFYEAVKNVNNDSIEHISYRRNASSFDFDSFTPLFEMVNESDYYQIGYDSHNEIKEIIHYDTGWIPMKMVVYSFPKFRIMLLKYKFSQDFQWVPVAFLLSKQQRYMFTTLQMLRYPGYGFGQLYPDRFPITRLEDISCIMPLDRYLYPFQRFLAYKGDIYLASKINYQAESRTIKNEKVQIFLPPLEKKKIKPSFCLDNLSQLFGAADIYVTAEPSNYKRGYPLWIYCGVSGFR